MALKQVLFFIVFSLAAAKATAWKASCQDPYYGSCYGIAHTCPPGCRTTCEVDCKLCKPICSCDRPGAVCQDPRFIGGDGIMFYFHGKKDRDFCLVSDTDLHINGRFIGKTRTQGLKRDFTWVQSLGIRFGAHQLYIGANKVATWDDAVDQLSLQLDGQDIVLPLVRGVAWESGSSANVEITRVQDANGVTVRRGESLVLSVKVVPITDEESRTHGYGIAEDDCFAHLEMNFKFFELSPRVAGVLGQTYVAEFQNRVKIGVAMPIMGGEEKFATSHLFATDCRVSRFGEPAEEELRGVGKLSAASCGGGGGRGVVCRR